MSDERAVFAACYEAYLKSDWDGLGALFREDVVLESPGTPAVHGREAVLAYHRGVRTAFPDMSGDYAVILGGEGIAGGRKVMTGTNAGPLTLAGGREIPATGKLIQIPESDWMEVRNGQCVHHWIYYDRALLLQQLGFAAAK